jgi:4-hydroxyphenylpyruvate dioxygenase
MNVIVNARRRRGAHSPARGDPVIAAVALRVRDAAAAYRHAIERGTPGSCHRTWK